jgi:SAM-dependent methyltransferase
MESASYRESHQGKGDDYQTFCESNSYARLLWRLESRALTHVVQSLPAALRTTYLDFASGTGRILAHLSPHFKIATAVDVSEQMLGVGRRRVPTADFVHADITRDSEAARGPFDVVTAFRFFLNAEPSLRLDAMRAITARMHQDSVFIFNNHRNRGSLTHRLLLSLGKSDKDLHYMPHSDVTALLFECGLRIRTTFHFGVLPATEQRALLPSVLSYPLERAAAAIPLMAKAANDIVYVTQRA